MDMLEMLDRGTAWTASKVAGATDKLDQPTPCEEWDVRALINHLLAGQELFAGAARGKPAAPPTGPPPELIGDDPVAQYEEARQETLKAFREPGAAENNAMMLGIAFADQLVHGWDLAKATGQDATMPDGLAQAAYGLLEGRLTDETRGDLFKPEVKVGDDADAQTRLLAYLGRAS